MIILLQSNLNRLRQAFFLIHESIHFYRLTYQLFSYGKRLACQVKKKFTSKFCEHLVYFLLVLLLFM